MSEPHAFSDPELEGLLQELAKQDGSCLLQVPRSARPRALFEESPLPPRSTMTSLEKHLLDTKRLELAQSLRDACLFSIYEIEDSRTRCTKTVNATEEIIVPDLSSLSNRIEWHQAQDIEESSSVALLQTFVSEEGRRSSSLDLATAAIRLDPSDNARIYAAVGLINLGNHESATQALDSIARSQAPKSIRSFAAMNKAYSLTLREESSRACTQYRRAAELMESSYMPAASWLTTAIETGNKAEAQSAGIHLNSLIRESDPWLLEFVHMESTTRNSPLGPEPTRLARWVADHLMGASSTVARAALQD